MIKTIRQYLLSNDKVKKYVSKDIDNAIFHEMKPNIEIDHYVILKDKPLDMGFIETYQLDVLIYGKDITSLIEVEQEIRKMLNDKRGDKKVISDDLFIRDMTMLVGGGRHYDENKDRIISVQYFRIKI